jgi:hypothetical protein
LHKVFYFPPYKEVGLLLNGGWRKQVLEAQLMRVGMGGKEHSL